MGEIIPRPVSARVLPFTGERLTSALTGETQIEHFHRYLYARELCRGKNVLDVASGEGYGSALLAQVAASVVGVEIDGDVVEHARSSYQRDNLHFVQGDARCMEISCESIDVVISFETIEHFAEQEQFLKEVRRVLRLDGLFVVSTPDRDNYSPTETPANPYHVLELTQEEFGTLLSRHFAHVSYLVQRPIIGSVMMPSVSGLSTTPTLCFEKRGEGYFEGSQGLARPKYVIALASNREIGALSPTVYVETSRLGYLTPPDGCQALQLDMLKQELDSEKSRAADLQCQVTQRQQQIIDLQSRVTERQQQIIDVQSQVTERDQQIIDVQSQVTERQQQIIDVQSQVAECQQQIVELQSQLAASRAQVSSKDQFIDQIHASTSWRVTAPLRAVKTGLGRLRGRATSHTNSTSE